MTGRFAYSSPGRRGPSDPWFRIGTFDVNTSAFVAGLALLSLILDVVNDRLLEPLALIPDDVLNGQIWRLITWPLVNFINPGGLWTLLMIVMFWYFGRSLEAEMGRVRFLWFLGVLTVIPGIVAVALDVGAAGLRPVQLAVFVCFAIEYPQLRFFFGIPAWVIATVIVVIEILQLLDLRDNEGLIFLVVMLAVAVLTLRAFGMGASVPWVPRIPLPKSGSGTKQRRSSRSGGGGGIRRMRRKGQPNLTVVPPRPGAMPPRPPEMAAEIDALLDKIADQGIDSLTPAERARLEEHSKRLRGDG